MWYGWDCQGDQRGNKIASSMNFSPRVKRKKARGNGRKTGTEGFIICLSRLMFKYCVLYTDLNDWKD